MAADPTGGPEHGAPLKTRRSLRSRTTSSKIDPADFAMEAEVDEDADTDVSPAPGASYCVVTSIQRPADLLQESAVLSLFRRISGPGSAAICPDIVSSLSVSP